MPRRAARGMTRAAVAAIYFSETLALAHRRACLRYFSTIFSYDSEFETPALRE